MSSHMTGSVLNVIPNIRMQLMQIKGGRHIDRVDCIVSPQVGIVYIV